MPSEAPEEIFTVPIFATKVYFNIAQYQLALAVETFNGFFFAAVGSSAKPQKFAPCKNFPLDGS